MTRRFLSVFALITILSSAALIAAVGCEGDPPFATPLYIYNPGDPSTQNETYIMGITVTPQGVNMAVSGMQQFKATATYNTGITEVITQHVEWYTESPVVGVFGSEPGRFLAKRPGVAVIRCRLRSGTNTLTSSAAWVNSFYPNGDIPPAIVLNPNVNATTEGVLVGWDMNVTDLDLKGYNIWRTQVSSAHYSTDYGKVNPYPVLYPPYLDKSVVSGWYYYRVTAEDILGLMSAPSEEVAVFVTGLSHYGKSYDNGSNMNENGYGDSFSTAF